MVDRELLIKEKLEHAGLFDFQGFYGFAHSWLDEEEYGVVESKYAEKIAGNNREITAEWDASRELSDYIKMEMKIKFEVKEMVDVEVEIDGKKKKMNRGKLTIEIKAALAKDPDSKWDSSPFNRMARGLYDKYIIPSRLDAMRTGVRKDVQDLKEALKAYLELTGKR